VFAGLSIGAYRANDPAGGITHMKIHALVIALIASVAVALPAEAAAKKRKKEMQRAPAPVSAIHPHRHDVYFAGEYIGRDPDPNIRLFMLRNPWIYEGTE
jgi:hypothetical protein